MEKSSSILGHFEKIKLKGNLVEKLPQNHITSTWQRWGKMLVLPFLDVVPSPPNLIAMECRFSSSLSTDRQVPLRQKSITRSHHG